MPIDLETETIIPVRDVSKHTPGRPHVATIYRWAQRQLNPLETVRVGGRLFSSVEAISRFVDRCTNPESTPAEVAGSQREREISKAEAELKAAGV